MLRMLGVDEAGRGPLAGPVAVGAVAVPADFDVVVEFPGVADSKLLSEKKREHIYTLLVERVAKGDVRFSVVFGSAVDIDRLGISEVVRSAVGEAVGKLAPDAVEVEILLDGLLKAPREYAQRTIVGGDRTHPIISLASIAAKVERDRLMKTLAERYPQYRFEQHKGYGTRDHYAALAEYGPCALHRRSYLHLDKE